MTKQNLVLEKYLESLQEDVIHEKNIKSTLNKLNPKKLQRTVIETGPETIADILKKMVTGGVFGGILGTLGSISTYLTSVPGSLKTIWNATILKNTEASNVEYFKEFYRIVSDSFAQNQTLMSASILIGILAGLFFAAQDDKFRKSPEEAYKELEEKLKSASKNSSKEVKRVIDTSLKAIKKSFVNK